MKKLRYYALFWALVLSVLAAMGAGEFLLQRGMSRGESRLEALARYPESVQRAGRATEPVTEPTQVPATESVTEPPETQAAEPVTEPSLETVPPETVPPETTGPLAVFGEDESYFDDALFIGDSRTDGLRLYCPIGEASYFCTTGMTIFDVFEETAPNKELVWQTLEQVLAEKQFGKIYVTLGLNELSEEDIVLKAEYQMVLNHLRRLQPDAKLIVHGIMPLGKEKSASASWFSMERIARANEMLRGVAEEVGGYYLDASPVFAGEDGYLREGLSYDGCHLYAKNYWIWAQFLCENAL